MKKLQAISRRKLPADSLNGLQNIINGVKSGEVTGVAYTAIRRDGAISTGWSTYEGEIALIGGLEHCKQRLLKTVDSWGSV